MNNENPSTAPPATTTTAGAAEAKAEAEANITADTDPPVANKEEDAAAAAAAAEEEESPDENADKPDDEKDKMKIDAVDDDDDGAGDGTISGIMNEDNKEDDNEDEDLFVLRPTKKRNNKKRKKKLDQQQKHGNKKNNNKKAKFAINIISTKISSSVADNGDTKEEDSENNKPAYKADIGDNNINMVVDFDDDYDSDDTDNDSVFSSALSFYEETHEEQDPTYVIYQLETKRLRLQQVLNQLDKLDVDGRQDIDAYIQIQIQQKTAQTDASLLKYTERAEHDQKRDFARLQHLYEQKKASNSKKISDGMQLLRNRHGSELHVLQQQQQQQQSKGNNNNNNNKNQQQQQFQAAQQQLRQKHQRQLSEFTMKGEQVKRKVESDFVREQDKIRNAYTNRLKEIENNRTKIAAKLQGGFAQIRQRYIKRHLQRIMKKKDECLQAIYKIQDEQKKRRDNIIAGIHTTTTTTANPAGGTVPGSSSSGSGHVGTSATTTTTSTTTDGSKKATTTTTDAATTTADHTATATTTSSSSMIDKAQPEFRQPAPIKSALDWALNLSEVAGAAARHKHRKTIMSQTSRQLAIEIHNEGLWVSIVNPSGGDNANTQQHHDDNSTTTSGGDTSGRGGGGSGGGTMTEEFITWGSRAHSILESIVCGEIPQGYERFDYGEVTTALQGGQIRCVLTDLRVSEASASAQRSKALVELEEMALAELERKAAQLLNLAQEAEKSVAKTQQEEKDNTANHENAMKEVEKAKRMQDEFITKFRNFIGPDGKVLKTPNPNDQKELQKAITSYQHNLDNMGNKEKAAKQLLSDINERILKLQAVAKSAQKNATLVANILKRKKAARAAIGGTTATARRQVEAADLERASTRVKDVIAALKRAADSRREIMNEKKSNNSVSSTWVQSFPGMPNALKKSLWHRMHRRKQQIVLRPTEETMLNELRAKVLESVASAPYQQGRTAASRNKRENAEEELLKAEQMFLLAMHPNPKEQLPTVPLSKSGDNNWAEPGWHLVLDVPDSYEQQDPSRILPCRPKFPVLEKNLSEIASAPGRQAASLLRTSHFRCLSSPLSAFAVASSPAETGASMPSSNPVSEGDPLHVTKEAMSIGYSFTTKPVTVKHAPSRRKSAPKDSAAAVAAAAAAATASTSTTTMSSTSQPQQGGPVEVPVTTTRKQTSTTLEQKPKPKQATHSKAAKVTTSTAPAPAASTSVPAAEQQKKKKSEAKRRRSSKTKATAGTRKQAAATQKPDTTKKVETTVTTAPASARASAAAPPPPPAAAAAAAMSSSGRDSSARGSVSSQSVAAQAAAAAAAQQYNQFLSAQMPMQPTPAAGQQRRPSHPQAQQQQQQQQPHLQQYAQQATQNQQQQAQFQNQQQQQLQYQNQQQQQQQAQYQSQQQQRQMAQLMMQQQAAAASSPHRPQQVTPAFPPQAMHQMQFYAPIGHPPNTPGAAAAAARAGQFGPQHQPNISPMHLQGRRLSVQPQQNMPTMQNAAGQHVGRQQQGKQGGPNDSNDPLFMLK